MRIERGSNMFQVSQNAKGTEGSSGDEIRRGVQNHFDQFEKKQIAVDVDSAIENFAKNFSLTNSSELPEIVGKANAPNIPEEAIERLRQQIENARQKK